MTIRKRYPGKYRNLYLTSTKTRIPTRVACPLFGKQCRGGNYGRIVRIPIEKDRRRFVPLPRMQPKAKKIYKLRSASERFFSRLKKGAGFNASEALQK